MPLSNYERMIKMAEDVFASREDPEQLDVNQEVLERLKRIHPATVSEQSDENGPIAWILLIPTTFDLMHQFLEKKISEKELFERTPLNIKYEALYLCSGMVLEEYRRKGIAMQLTLDAIKKIRNDHPLKALFAWPFTKEGDYVADALAKTIALPLYKRY